jgi:predicted small lipoprotein YifL
LACDRISLARALVAALLVPLALGACGRRGPLDPPPSAATPAPPATPGSGPTSFLDPTTPFGGPQQAAVQTPPASPPPPQASQPMSKTFILDPLLQ